MDENKRVKLTLTQRDLMIVLEALHRISNSTGLRKNSAVELVENRIYRQLGARVD